MNESTDNPSLRPLSPLQSLNVQNGRSVTLSTPEKQHSEKKQSPTTTTPTSNEMARWCEDFGADDDCRDENDCMHLSPIQNLHLNSTVERMITTPFDSSFPENEHDEEVHVHSPTIFDQQEQRQQQHRGEEETREERVQRELEESEALARQIMAEEAMATYAMSIESLRYNADQFTEEDLAALQAAIAEEDPEEEENDESDDSHVMSYDALLRLGERIGDVKEERWAFVAQDKIENIPTLMFDLSMAKGKDENHTEVKCLICQENYEQGEELSRLPCEHCFHKSCIDQWLNAKDTCAFCRKSIVSE
jgi:DNA-directed RNA polymerase subunit RPC12/RpoP